MARPSDVDLCAVELNWGRPAPALDLEEGSLMSELGKIAKVSPPIPARKLRRSKASSSLQQDCHRLCAGIGLDPLWAGDASMSRDWRDGEARPRHPSPTCVVALDNDVAAPSLGGGSRPKRPRSPGVPSAKKEVERDADWRR